MWEAIISKLLGSFSETAAQVYLEKRRLKTEIKLEEMRGKIEWQKALTKRASESEGRDHEWGLEHIKNSGWKDEAVLILISIPLPFVFVKQTQQAVLEGFRILEQTPLWYQGLVVTIYLAIYGIRKWRRQQAINSLIKKAP